MTKRKHFILKPNIYKTAVFMSSNPYNYYITAYTDNPNIHITSIEYSKKSLTYYIYFAKESTATYEPTPVTLHTKIITNEELNNLWKEQIK